MATNWVQFQQGMSMPEFLSAFGTGAQCARAVEQARWPSGYHCPCCEATAYCMVLNNRRPLLQCIACRRQTSLTAGSLFENTKLPLTTWLLAIYLLSQAKTGLLALALKRQVGMSCPTAWMLHHKVLHAMAARDAVHQLSDSVQVDDAYLGGERAGGKVGGGSENKVPLLVAVSLHTGRRPRDSKLSRIAGFTSEAVKQWAKTNLKHGSSVASDGLACFAAVVDVGCNHMPTVVGQRRSRELPEFKWVNTILGNL